VAAASGSLLLFVCGDTPALEKGVLDLFLFGASQSGVFASLPLYTHNADDAARASGVLPLFVSGSGSQTLTGSLTLNTAGTSYSLSAALDLYTANQGLSSSLTLWVSGQGFNAGAMPFSGVLPLFVKRDENAVLNLWVQAPGYPGSGQLHLYVQGASPASGVLNLAIPYTVGSASAGLDLYAHGW
jgi:hypothetical protein